MKNFWRENDKMKEDTGWISVSYVALTFYISTYTGTHAML
jgi:hypothetical protein